MKEYFYTLLSLCLLIWFPYSVLAPYLFDERIILCTRDIILKQIFVVSVKCCGIGRYVGKVNEQCVSI